MADGSPLALPAFRQLLVFQVLFGLAFSVFFLLPKYLTTGLGADADGVGLVMGVYSLGALASVPFIGPWTRRLGAGRCLLGSSLALALASLLFLSVHEAGTLAIVARLIQGAACTVTFAVGSVVAAGLVAPGRITSAMALFISAGLVTIAIGPAVTEWALVRHGAAPVFLVSAVLGLASVIPVLQVMRSAPQLTRPIPDDGPDGQSLVQPRPEGRFLVALIAAVVFGLTAGAMFTFHQPLALERGISPVSGFLVAFTLTATGIRLVGGGLMDAIGYQRLSWTSLAAYGLVTIGMAALRPGLLELTGILFGLTHGLFFPALIALTLDAEPSRRASRSAWMNGGFNLGGLGVIALGPLAGHSGYALVFVVLGILCLATAAFLALKLRGYARVGSVTIPPLLEGACPALD